MLDELCGLIQKHVVANAPSPLLIPNLILVTQPSPTTPCPIVVEPVFALIAQGAKRVQLGQQTFDYRAGQFLIVTVDLPADAEVVEASVTRPYLGCGLKLRPESIASLLLESGSAAPAANDRPGIALGALSKDLVDAVVRLLRLLEQPSDIPILAASLEREILWRLINGPQGAMVRQIGLADSRIARIGGAIRWLRGHFAETIKVEQLAEIACMSVSSLHRHFRLVTSFTPIQYQKQLRLQAARARLMTMQEEVAGVGFAVGYASPSQFSRDYRRLFGKPPGQDGSHLRNNLTVAPTTRAGNARSSRR